jgi:hypothetical protein
MENSKGALFNGLSFNFSFKSLKHLLSKQLYFYGYVIYLWLLWFTGIIPELYIIITLIPP